MKPKIICIVGLGLMGGSLAAACRKKFPHARILGVSRDSKAVRTALRKKWIHEGGSELSKAIPRAGLVVICTPVDTLKAMLIKIDKLAKPGTLVTDVGSVKGEIARQAEPLRLRLVHVIGARPMTGSHERGISAGRPNLYGHGFTFVARDKTTSPKAFSEVKTFWEKISPKVFVVSAAEHDRITGEVSHLSHLLAFCLALAVRKKSQRYAGPSFLEMTRIAQGHPSVWVPIFRANRRAVLKALGAFERRCREFKEALRKPDSRLEKMLTLARQKRRQISL